MQGHSRRGWASVHRHSGAQKGFQVQCGQRLDGRQVCHLKVSLDCLSIEPLDFEFFRPFCSPLSTF